MNNNCWNTGEENRKEKAKAWVGTAAHIAACPAGLSAPRSTVARDRRFGFP